MALFGYAQTVFFFLAEIHDAGIFPASVALFALVFVFSWPCEHVKRLLRKKEEGVTRLNHFLRALVGTVFISLGHAQ